MERERKFKTLLETWARWKTILVSAIFLILFVVSVIIGAVGPKALIYEQQLFNVTKNYFYGDVTFTTNITGMSGSNQEFYQALVFYSNYSDVLGLSKKDIFLNTLVEGRNSGDDSFTTISSGTHQQTLTCSQGVDNNTPIMQVIFAGVSAVEDSIYACAPINTVHQLYIKFEEYRISYKLQNFDLLRNMSLVQDKIKATWLYSNPAFTKFEIAWRYVFLGLSLINCIVFYFLCKRKMSYRNWTVEQKWMGYLAINLILYNNPLFAADFYAGTWVFPFLNICFLVTFFCSLFMALLVFTNYVITRDQDRTFCKFYLLKAIIVGVIWVFAIVFLSWSSFHEKDDPTYSTADEVPGFVFIEVVFILFVAAYLLLLFFYIAQTLTRRHLIPPSYGPRYKMIWFLSFLVILATASNVIVIIAWKGYNNAASFLSYFSLYNLYVYLLCILLLPSNEENSADEEGLSGQRDLDDTNIDMN